jgi:hypothetical protein
MSDTDPTNKTMGVRVAHRFIGGVRVAHLFIGGVRVAHRFIGGVRVAHLFIGNPTQKTKKMSSTDPTNKTHHRKLKR